MGRANESVKIYFKLLHGIASWKWIMNDCRPLLEFSVRTQIKQGKAANKPSFLLTELAALYGF